MVLRSWAERGASMLSYFPFMQKYYAGLGAIFMLHNVLKTQEKIKFGDNMNVSQKFLESFIKRLQIKGFSFLGIDELCENLIKEKRMKKAVVFSLDDGYKNTYTNAYPLFKAYNVPFVVFVATKFIGTENHMSMQELKALHKDKLCTLGGHTHSHYSLATLENKESVIEEISLANRILEENIGAKIKHIAYPYGCKNSTQLREVEVVKELGLISACSTRRGAIYKEHKDYLSCLPRIILRENSSYRAIGRLRKARIVKFGGGGAVICLEIIIIKPSIKRRS
ncbi:polysaccharide deacetylase family protein [Helicobacter cetorum]|uniref:polysaccharide deacetylase family protein n=1 Tax=Helicobacter cetorum TaxID=138563 RepID=UPI000CF05A6A|nr:polysaccharide deacetylase family protein [Helicobacter cetorum]